MTCLHYAAEGNHVDVVRYLITECNCDPIATDEDGNTVLHKAAAHGSMERHCGQNSDIALLCFLFNLSDFVQQRRRFFCLLS